MMNAPVTFTISQPLSLHLRLRNWLLRKLAGGSVVILNARISVEQWQDNESHYDVMQWRHCKAGFSYGMHIDPPPYSRYVIEPTDARGVNTQKVEA